MKIASRATTKGLAGHCLSTTGLNDHNMINIQFSPQRLKKHISDSVLQQIHVKLN